MRACCPDRASIRPERSSRSPAVTAIFASSPTCREPSAACSAASSSSAAAMIADSPDEVRLRVREQLMQGASQIKLTAGGGVASPFSPLDVSTFTEAELRAAVEAAENWGTYVCHACLHVRFDPAVDRRRRQSHRARASDGRCHGAADGRERNLAEHATLPRHGAVLPRLVRRNRPRCGRSSPAPTRLCAGEEIQDQDRVRHRHPVLQGARRTARRRCLPA